MMVGSYAQQLCADRWGRVTGGKSSGKQFTGHDRTSILPRFFTLQQGFISIV